MTNERSVYNINKFMLVGLKTDIKKCMMEFSKINPICLCWVFYTRHKKKASLYW